MDTEPTIDRTRLERYPLGFRPVLMLVPLAIMMIGSIVIVFPTSTAVGLFFEYGPSDHPERWILDMQFRRPLLGLVLGMTTGMILGFFQRRSFRGLNESWRDRYFLTRTDRRNARSHAEIRLMRRWVLAIVFLVLAILPVSFVLRTSYITFALGLTLTNLIGSFPRHHVERIEILRRRRIALAWECVDPPDDRLTIRQKLAAATLWLVSFALVIAAAYLVHNLKTQRVFRQYTAYSVYDKGRSIDKEQASALERRLKRKPSDYDARLTLLGYFWGNLTTRATPRMLKRGLKLIDDNGLMRSILSSRFLAISIPNLRARPCRLR